MERQRQRIRQAYLGSTGGSMALFQTVLAVAEEVGLDAALALLERCVLVKRMSWFGKHLSQFA